MAKVFSDYGDISKTREAADARAASAAKMPLGAHAQGGAIVEQLDALRLEIRAAAQTISSAIGAAVEEWRGEVRGER